MHLLVCYDINVQTAAGQRRLRRIAIICKDFGQRVQYSVFECQVNETQLHRLRERLLREIDPATDSLRIYRLAANREEVIEAHGRDRRVDFSGPLVI